MSTGEGEARADQAPLGVHFVFEAGIKKIEQQEKLIDSLDLKMGVLVGLLGTFIVGLLVAGLTSEASKVSPLLWRPTKVILSLGILLIAACLYFAFSAFTTRQQSLGIRYSDLIKWTNEEVGVTKANFLATLLSAIDESGGEFERKQKWAKFAIRTAFGALVVLWISIVLLGIQLLTGGLKV